MKLTFQLSCMLLILVARYGYAYNAYQCDIINTLQGYDVAKCLQEFEYKINQADKNKTLNYYRFLKTANTLVMEKNFFSAADEYRHAFETIPTPYALYQHEETVSQFAYREKDNCINTENIEVSGNVLDLEYKQESYSVILGLARKYPKLAEGKLVSKEKLIKNTTYTSVCLAHVLDYLNTHPAKCISESLILNTCVYDRKL